MITFNGSKNYGRLTQNAISGPRSPPFKTFYSRARQKNIYIYIEGKQKIKNRRIPTVLPLLVKVGAVSPMQNQYPWAENVFPTTNQGFPRLATLTSMSPGKCFKRPDFIETIHQYCSSTTPLQARQFSYKTVNIYNFYRRNTRWYHKIKQRSSI
jgi:hypothetical protein